YATVGNQKVSATIIIQETASKIANVRMMLRTKYSPGTDTLEYLLMAVNTGPNMATGLKISMPLPEDSVYISHSVCWNGKDWIDQDSSYDPATGVWDLSNKNIIKYQYPQLKIEAEPLNHSQMYEITVTRIAQNEINHEPSKIVRKHWVSEPLEP
ncbi:MAG: DUF11 domain-containing protein, partial [Methanobacterium sp.]|nr:DUF11 domain-containing protein [Methanobacterium sp.]